MKKKKYDVQVLLPKDGVLLDLQKDERLYFLAGPIRGAKGGYGAWQSKAIELLAKEDPGCIVACPCRWGPENRWYDYRMIPQTKFEDPSKPLMPFASQTLWERHYLEMASYYGCIIFWLPTESKTHPRLKKDGPYAQDTYGELGRWSIKSAYPEHFSFQKAPGKPRRVNLVVGGEPKFPGLSTIKKNYSADHRYEFPLWYDLETTIVRAVHRAMKIQLEGIV
jgi:hypothetical protein